MKGIDEVKKLICINNPLFTEEDFLKYVKWDIEYLHEMMRKKEFDKIRNNISDKCINKIKNDLSVYRIDENFDNVNVSFPTLYDYIEENDEKTIKVRAVMLFFDNVSNNEIQESNRNRYWEDVWIISLKQKNENEISDSNCPNCGAKMEALLNENALECKYCGTKKYIQINCSNWIIEDIEIENRG